MSTFRSPVGPQPARVYWRRRLVVLLGLIAVVVIIVLIVVRPGSGTPAPTPLTTPTAGAVDAATGETDAGGECDPATLTVEAITDATSYEAGVIPQLSFTLKSREAEPCTVEAGSDLQEFRITSGEEVIWSSRDCQTAEQPAVITLQPGVPLQSPAIPWDRTRSAPDTCDVAREPVTAGGASYHLTVIVGDLESAETKQFLLF